MAKRELKIFIASPGGLESERDAVEKICSDLNSSTGDALNVSLLVRRFEQLPARAGRPQSQINPWVDDCDVLIAILHRRWGSASGEGSHTGFSEEFFHAIERYEKFGRPTVSLHFKKVEEDSESDPGPQLSQVLEFRKKVEAEYVALYERFETLDEFKLNITNLLNAEILSVAEASPDVADTETQGTRKQDPARPEALPVPQISGQAAISEVLQKFAAAVRGEGGDNVLDRDRLHLFSTALSVDQDTPSVHLSNRSFQRRGSLDYSGFELNALFYSYLHNIGCANGAEQRTVPFASIVGREWIGRKLTGESKAILGIQIPGVPQGALRVLTALSLRPEDMWPDTEAAQAESIGTWPGLAESGLGAELVRYWAAVGKEADVPLAKALSLSDSESVRAVGDAAISLLEEPEHSDHVISVDPTLVLDDAVSSRWSGNPLHPVSEKVLDNLIVSSIQKNRIRALALNEMARRDSWTPKVVKFLFEEDTFELFRGPSLRTLGRELLWASVSPIVIGIVIDEAVKRAKDAPHIVRQMVAANPAYKGSYSGAPESLLAKGDTESFFELSVNDASHSGVALKVLNGGFAPLNDHLERLREAGADGSTVRFVEELSEASAFTYLVRSPAIFDQGLRGKLREAIAAESRFGLRLIYLLEEVAQDKDIPLILDIPHHDWKSDGVRLGRLLEKATLVRLNGLLDSSENAYVQAAILELTRRGRPPALKVLRRLMRHDDDRVRLLALRAGMPKIRDREAFIESYIQEEPAYYYNIVSELDRVAAAMPETT